ncbi:MAG: NusG domain II-containing protein [Nitrospiraceae bacterium]|nr:NusG domain II-containing protein [Nitrospiraceae bacterium]
MKTVIRNTTCADRLLFFLLILASCAGIFISREAVSQSSDVLIEVNGKPAYTFPLAGDRTVTVNGPCGPTVVEIKDMKVRIREASCPNRLCLKEGWIAKGVIVCLPNRIVVTVGGKSAGSPRGVDAVTG